MKETEGTEGVLYLIPCPISEGESVWSVLPASNGRVMSELDYFIVENVRSARRFLSKSGLKVSELEFRELSEHTTDPRGIDVLCAPIVAGRSAGVISEAGVPGVADPGAMVVRRCHELGVRVVPLVGPSSIILAMMASGLNGQSFAFNGYLPVKDAGKAIRNLERRALSEGQAQMFIETPYRNVKLVEQLLLTLGGETRLTIAVDLTGADEFVETHGVREWRGRKLPELHKKPAIFVIGA